MSTKLQQLSDLGQSIWLDNISRHLLDSGELQNWIDQGLRGITSNPSIFMNAISKTHDYDAKIRELKDQGKDTFAIYDELTIADVQQACDAFLPVFEKTNKLDGYVSLEINPKLANETEQQYKEGIRLWEKVNRPNLMIKVPGTTAGCQVVEGLVAAGVNVNVTLIFSSLQYASVIQSYWKGLERLANNNKDVSVVRSVASFFVSRIDGVVDAKLDEKIEAVSDQAEKEKLNALKGKAAVANCEIAFDMFQKMQQSEVCNVLSDSGAHRQRLLWASTSTKNPEYNDVKYITELIGPQTVNTVPTHTLDAFMDHGVAINALPKDVQSAKAVIDELKTLEIDLDQVCSDLLAKGIKAFEDSFDQLLASIDEKSAKLCA